MTYPDNEIVSYFYDLGGNLTQMKSQYNGQNYTFIKQIVYDEFEQRTAIKYGNNTVNTYTYDEKLRRLKTMTATQSNNSLMLDNRYDFDLIGNITKLRNLAQPSGYNMGGGYLFEYQYDKFNRLKEASGNFTGYTGTPAPTFGDLSANFTLEMEYDELHNITKKSQTHIKNGQVFEPNNYVNNYVYSTTKPHQIETIFNEDTQETEYFGYDANGNLRRQSGIDDRAFFWDEQNRLRSMVIDGGKMMHYIYDASGERTLKAQSEIQELYENGEPTDGGATMDSYTTYPSPFLTIDEKSFYTKHYFAGSDRIASRPAGKAEFNDFGVDPGIIELRMKQRRDAQIVADTVDLGLLKFDEKENPGSQPLLEVYYFHPDHLGSSTMISDGAGYAYQMFLNLPFGETLAEQRRSFQLNNPYKFNGKELDAETGLYYYGARYYDPRLSVFISVDPLAEQTMEPYQYVSNNPIVLIDPDGLSPISVFVKATAKLGIKRAGQSFVKNQIRNRLASYSSKAWGKQLLKDASSFVDMTMNTSWWEYALEVVPIVGDAYGASKLGKQGYALWKGLERFEAIAEIGVKASKNAWKKLGESSDAIGNGSGKIKQYIDKFNNQGTHLNADDLGGAIKEKFGLNSNGQHLKEVTEALEGMGGQIGRLKSDIRNGVFEGDALKSAKGVLNSAEQQYNKINRTLNSADKQVKKLGKFE